MTERHDWSSVYPAGLSRTFDRVVRPLGVVFEESAAAQAESVAFTCGGSSVTRGELLARSDRLAGWLTAVGDVGDRLLVRVPNGFEFVVAALAAWRSGWILVPVSPALTKGALADVISDAEPAAAVVQDADREDLYGAAARAGCRVPVAPPAGRTLAGELPEIDVEHPAVLQYTSGTTGRARAAIISHRNLVANAFQNQDWFEWTESDVILGALPLFHTWGLCTVLTSVITSGARAALLPEFDASETLQTIERHGVTVAYGSATMFHRLLDAAGNDAPSRMRSLRYVKAGAMLVGGDLPERWANAVPDVPMINGYGLTEASPEVTNNPPGGVRAGTVGVPLPGTDLRLCDPAAPNEDLGDGPGELQVRGPQVTRGYWNRPRLSREAITSDGWLRTGDLARFDEAGYVVIVDRLKDLIKFRGYSIVPGAVEAALRTVAGVRDAVVIGVPDPVDGEVPVAFLECDQTGAPNESALLAACGERLTPHERPRRFEVVAEIPRNHVGKPLRRVLRARAIGTSV